jgi:hypothetical protein
MLELWAQQADVVGHQQMIGFTPSASLAGRGVKRCETHELLNQAGVALGTLVSREKRIYPTRLTTT